MTLRTMAKTEGDDLGQLFVTRIATATRRAARWLEEQAGGERIPMEVRNAEGYDEFLQELVSLVQTLEPGLLLERIPVEQRLASVPVEQRLAGLSPEQAVLALPDEVLRNLPDEYLATLPEAIRTAVRARIGR